jgi:hypothetical protein
LRIIAVDTGVGTGLAYYHTDKGYHTAWETSEFDTADIELADVVVIEKYQQRSNVRTQDDATKINGIIEKFCKAHNIPLVEQMPADAKRFGRSGSKDPYGKIKALGWYLKTKDNHRNDASNHLLKYIVKNKLITADDVARLKTAM